MNEHRRAVVERVDDLFSVSHARARARVYLYLCVCDAVYITPPSCSGWRTNGKNKVKFTRAGRFLFFEDRSTNSSQKVQLRTTVS